MASERESRCHIGRRHSGLNPCSCGRWLQRIAYKGFNKDLTCVLILVLVEDGFREKPKPQKKKVAQGLNPCSCGRWLQRRSSIFFRVRSVSLNPCSCGRWLQRGVKRVFMEYGRLCLNPCSCGRWLQSCAYCSDKLNFASLNPCSCGRWLQSPGTIHLLC